MNVVMYFRVIVIISMICASFGLPLNVQAQATTGSISGTVTDQSTGLPLEHVWVHLLSSGSGSCSDANGNYTISGLDFDSYNVEAQAGTPWCGSNTTLDFASEWWPESMTLESANTIEVSVENPDVVGINFTLGPGGTISGNIQDTEGNSLPNVYVSVDGVDVPIGQGGCSDASGNFTISGLALGFPLKISAGYDYCGFNPYPVEYWQESATILGATSITLNETNRHLTSIDFTLGPATTISGVVRDENGDPITGVGVSVRYQPVGGGETQGNCSDPNTGEYTLYKVPLGSYIVSAGYDCGNLPPNDFGIEYWQEAASFENGVTPIIVSESNPNITGIDFTLTVTDETDTYSPYIIANIPINVVVGEEWPIGIPVNLTIDDPRNGVGVDYADTALPSEPYDWNPSVAGVEFHLGDSFTLAAGMVVKLANGSTTKILVVTHLEVQNIDLDTDIVVGIAPPHSGVWVICEESSRTSRTANADASGAWMVDFGNPGINDDEQEICDIRPGVSGLAINGEPDNDFTMYSWDIPNPSFGVRANDDRVEGWQWSFGANLTIEIDDPATQQSPDHTGYTTVGVADWNPNETWFNSEFAGAYDIKVGDLVTVSDGSTTKQHTVVNLNFTDINTETDQVFGTANPGQLVNIWTCWESDPCVNRDETADQNGDWMTDFSIPGEQDWEQEIADLQVGSWIDSSVNDEDGDSTMYGITVEPPPPSQCQPGNTVTGTVFEHDSVTPIPNITIQVEDFNTGAILFTSSTDQNGQFGCSLPDGDYRILAVDDNSNYSLEYFDQANDTNATLLQVTGGAQFTNVNFTLSRLPLMEHLTFNLDNPLLQDLSVRQAIFLGTDRQTILNQAFLPHNIFGLISNSIVPPEHWAAAPASELTLYPFDPTQAGAILDAAGWINRDGDVYRENAGGAELAFTFKTTPAPTRVASAEIFRQNMEQIGIRLTVEHIQPSTLFDPGGMLDQGDFDIAEFAFGGGFDDETYLEPFITGPNNLSRYSNPAFDSAMANAASAPTEAQKLTFYYEAQAILSQDLPIIPLFTRQNTTPVTTSNGSNITVSPQSYLNIHFGNVTQGGVTTVLQANINPADLPPNFQLLGQVYDVGTSASFDSAQVCFSYDDSGLTPAQESAIRLFHLESGAWVDVTDSGYPDTVNNEVCGTVTSFSPFAVMFSTDSTPPAITWIGSIEDGDTFYFSFVPASPTCTATDADSGVNGGCTVSGYSTLVGSHTLVASASDHAGNTATETRDYTVLAWTLKGFYQPVDMNGIYNLVKGGSTVPLKFEVFAGSTEVTDTAAIKSLSVAETACNANALTDEIELTSTGNTGLTYQDGQFIYNWKTPKTHGKCLRVMLTTIDGSTLLAYFRLK